MRKILINALVLQMLWVVAPVMAQKTPSMNPTQGAGGLGVSKERPANAETVITAMDETTFDNRTGVAEFVGSVTVKDPQFTMTCDRLKAYLNSERKGLERVEAIGNVVIRQENKDTKGKEVVSVAKSGNAVFYPATGDVDLTEWPKVEQGINAHIATDSATKMILNRAGKINTFGSSRTMIIDTGDGVK